MQLRLLNRFRNPELDFEGAQYVLREPVLSDFEEWVKVREESRSFLEPWEPVWPVDDLSLMGFRRRLKAYVHQRQTGWGRTFFMFERHTNNLLGGVSLTRIHYGVSCSATLGYWMGVSHAGHGLMQKALMRTLGYAFNDLSLRRIEAACLPHNGRSEHVLLKCGFQREGYARQYLEIAGKLEDHVLFAILKQDYLAKSG